TAIATNILSNRLSWLVDFDMLTRRAYSTAPTRYEYRLTEKALDYYPVLLALLKWGDRWYVAPEGPPVLLRHDACEAELEFVVACSSCGGPLRARDVTFEVSEAPPDADADAREAS
ncbi:MAG: helix-turn-helix transcriptional regulator, partial [Caulobacterales bacterium]|nr:helix-turn-helix transcriptional regulator [Caulobacterales bacterium]